MQKWRKTENEILNGEHNYWIISAGKNDLSWNETIPLLLTNNRLIRLARFNNGKMTRTFNQTFVYLKELIWDYHYNNQVPLDEDFLKKYSEIRKGFIELNSDFSNNIKSAAVNFLNSYSIPKNNYFRIIALFGILESLLINSNSKNDYGTKRDLEKNRNTITRQLQTKILYLHREFKNELKFEDYFVGSNPETILKDLYYIRSKKAHGQGLNWVDDINSLKPIEKGITGERFAINEFMTELCRHILVKAISNPDEIKEFREI